MCVCVYWSIINQNTKFEQVICLQQNNFHRTMWNGGGACIVYVCECVHIFGTVFDQSYIYLFDEVFAWPSLGLKRTEK